MKKKRRGWIWVIIIVVLLAGLGIVLPRMLPSASLGANAQLYRAEQVTKGDIKVTVHGTGSIEPLESTAVSMASSGKVESVLVENGDTVQKGQLLAMLDDSEINAKIDALKEQIVTQDAAIAKLRAMPATKYLTAPVDCRIKAIYAKEGEDANVSMSASNALLLLSTDGKMKVSFVPEKGVTVSPGAPVTFWFGKVSVNGFITLTPDSTTDQAEAVMNNDSVAEGREAVIRDENGNMLGKGKIEINRPLLVTATSGTIDEVYVKAGDKVKAGKRLVRLSGAILNPDFEAQLVKRQQLEDELDDAYADLADLSVLAPVGGIVSDLMIEENSVAQDGMAVCTIQQATGYKLVVAIDELDIPRIKTGQKAEVKIDALPEGAATGEVIKISPLGVKANDVTTYDVTLKVDAPAGTLAKMSASADIEVAFKSGALLVPVEALHTVSGKTWVYLALPQDTRATASTSPDGASGQGQSMPGGRMFGNFFGQRDNEAETKKRETAEVTVGLISDSTTEILAGLSEGDEVAVPISQSSSGMFAFGNGGSRNSGSGQAQ